MLLEENAMIYYQEESVPIWEKFLKERFSGKLLDISSISPIEIL